MACFRLLQYRNLPPAPVSVTIAPVVASQAGVLPAGAYRRNDYAKSKLWWSVSRVAGLHYRRSLDASGSNGEKSELSPLSFQYQLDTVCPEIIAEKDDTSGVCPICLDEKLKDERVRRLPCKHDFHSR